MKRDHTLFPKQGEYDRSVEGAGMAGRTSLGDKCMGEEDAFNQTAVE